jgi:hypothetical protein
MSRHHSVWLPIACSAALMMGACGRKTAAPERQTTSGVQATAEPISVKGCLKQGTLADNTFVLLVSHAGGGDGGPTATYQVMSKPELNLAERVGQEVQVTGTLRSREEVTSTGGADVERAAKGTSGTPVVETKSDVDLRRLDPTTVTATGVTCPQ